MTTFDRSPARSAAASLAWMIPLVALLLGVVLWRFWPRGEGPPLHDPDAAPRLVAARGDLAEDEKSTIALFKRASPSVVHITTLTVRRDLFSLNAEQIPQGTGSGFIWNPDGHIVTNFHVIQGAQVAKVTLGDHTTWNAQLVGVAPDRDLAVLRIAAPKDRLPPMEIGTSADLQVGQKVFAIGNPFGLDQTLTTGIISAVGREIKSVAGTPIKGVIQTDAAINPGNSGGPLLDSAGRLVGVNTAIYSPSGASAGIGFAIPVDEVNRAVPELIKHGRIVRPGLGVSVAEDQQTRQMGLQGVLIVSVLADSPAAKAGLRPSRRDADGDILFGDVIVEIDGKPIRSTKDLFGILQEHKVGDTVTVTVLRNGQRLQVQAILEAVS